MQGERDARVRQERDVKETLSAAYMRDEGREL